MSSRRNKRSSRHRRNWSSRRSTSSRRNRINWRKMKRGKEAGGQYMEQLEIRIREGRQIVIAQREERRKSVENVPK